MVMNQDGHVLLGKRKGAHGEGEYAFPGGKVDHGETFEACARREVYEETGIEITNIRFQLVANMRHYHPEHFTHINMRADHSAGEPTVCEPEKCEHWGWYSVNDLPSPLFRGADIALQQYRRELEGVYFDLSADC